MGAENADFSGYATKAGLKCSDGRTIMPNAFSQMDGKVVPLVWQHGHGDPTNVLGHALLEAREDGVYAYGFFNQTEAGQHAKTMVEHQDINSLSIYANNLVEKSKNVVHGVIRELSLVLSGANPGALIDNVRLAHSDDPDDVTELEDEAVIYSGETLAHAATPATKTQDAPPAASSSDEEDVTVQEVYDSMSPEQKDVLHYMIGAALEAADNSAEHAEGTNESDLAHQEGNSNMRNVFENGTTEAKAGPTLTHDQITTILEDGKKMGSIKESFLAHAADYGIDDISLLFPDAKNVTNTPQMIARRMEWVSKVIDGTKKSPFAKVKTMLADITADEARARGYVKGNKKIDEVIRLLRRTTGPTTIYKKQRLDRDDIIDITDFDVVNWLWSEINLMLLEELARAILVGDGRSSLSQDKVKDPEGAVDGDGIRSILHDDDLYVIRKELVANVSVKDSIKGLIRAMAKYRGSGRPTLFMSTAFLTEIMLEEDKFGRSLYETRQALADKLSVESIVTVDLFDEYDNLFCIVVNLDDYTIGTNAGGQLSKFDDFDIDYNQYKYLLETRLSGGLTKPFSAIVVTRAQGTLAVASAPSFDGTTDDITIPTVTGVTYLINDEPVTGTVHITKTTEVEAEPADGYYLETNSTRTWTFSV